MLNAIADLIRDVIFLIKLALDIWILLTLLIHFDIVNRASPIVNNCYTTLSRLLEPLLGPIRRMIEKYFTHFGGIDLSPIILWLLLSFIDHLLVNWFYINPLMANNVVIAK